MIGPRTYSIYVGHILQAIERATRFVADMSYDAFVEDERTNFATVRALEIIGEATKRLPPEARNLDPEMPWSDMARMRDLIIHQYDRVDLAVVWDTIHRDLPPLVSRLQRLQRVLEEREDDGS